jgi:hypothetical protein
MVDVWLRCRVGGEAMQQQQQQRERHVECGRELGTYLHSKFNPGAAKNR